MQEPKKPVEPLKFTERLTPEEARAIFGDEDEWVVEFGRPVIPREPPEPREPKPEDSEAPDQRKH